MLITLNTRSFLLIRKVPYRADETYLLRIRQLINKYMVNFCTLYNFQRIMMLELASNLKAYIAQISERYARASRLSMVVVVRRRRVERRPRTSKKIFKHVRKC